ncbi:MAG TPA: tyrosine-type recombinase/integrase, partial [Nakamurella sp.]|nr:tyrosine-type recombinase/integrase [Nakamurella sp.]
PEPAPSAVREDLPSARLARLADRAAATLAVPAPAVDHEQQLPAEALARVLDAVEASTAAATKRAYRSDWERFAGWAGRRRFPPLPAPPAVLSHYVTEAAAEQTGIGRWRYAPATLTRWVASINQVHTAAGLDAPGRAEVVRRALSGIRRIRATPQNRRAPLLLDDIRLLLTSLSTEAGGWPTGVAARRDMALLLMGFAGAHRRSELVALTLADVTLHPTDGLHVRVRTSKTDQEARGTVKALPYGRDPTTCPPCAYVRWRQILQAWDTTDPDGRRRAVMTVLRRQTTSLGGGEAEEENEPQHCCRGARLHEPADPARALFPRVHATGAIGATAMTGNAINEMIQRRATAAGFTPAQVDKLGGHSLRAGFVTEAFRAGADAHAIMRQTGHRSPVMLEVYAREHAPLVGNAVTRLGL